VADIKVPGWNSLAENEKTKIIDGLRQARSLSSTDTVSDSGGPNPQRYRAPTA
jgi:hypothetical protein